MVGERDQVGRRGRLSLRFNENGYAIGAASGAGAIYLWGI